MILAAALAALASALVSPERAARAEEPTPCGLLGPGQKTAEGLPPDSGEASGLVSSPRYPGVAWMVRDSGHPPDLYALRFAPDGTATAEAGDYHPAGSCGAVLLSETRNTYRLASY